MSDQSNWPGWTPPGDVAGDDEQRAPSDPPAHGERQDTVSFSTEATERIARTGGPPPPPPPPPGAVRGPVDQGAWGPPPHPGSPPTYGAGDWQPPPRPRRTGLVIGVIVGVLALVMLLGVGAVFVTRTVSDSGPRAAVPEEQGEVAPPPGAQDVPQGDLVAQAEAVLETINASEERMLAFQTSVFEAVGEDGTVDEGAAAIAQAAQDTGNDLTDLRSELRALAGGEAAGFDGLRDIRDTYAAHMDAWIEYVDAVAGSPTLAAPDSSDADGFWRDIESSGDDFVGAVASGLPDDLPQRLQDLADFIVERGFGGFDGGSGGNVV